jgi:ankyrin repeat protein
MKSLDVFTPRNPMKEAAIELSKQICFEGEELFKQERFQEALDTYRQDLQLCGEVFGKDHSYYANSLWDMGACYCRLGQSDFAIVMFRHARDIHEKACGQDHLLTARDIDGMAHCLTQAGQYDQALALRYRQLEILETEYGSESARVVRMFGEIATLYEKREQPDQALRFRQRKLAIEEKIYGTESARVIDTVIGVAEAYEQLGQYKHALPLRQRVLAHYEGQAETDGSKLVVAAMRPVADCLGKLGMFDLVLSLLQRAAEMNRAIYERENQQTARLFSALSETFQHLNNSANASKVREWGIRIAWDIIGSADEELHKGAMGGDMERFRKALKNGAEIDAKDKYGRTALIEAATHGHRKAAELLIELGADVNCADRCGRTPLSSAVAHTHPEIFELLLRQSADAEASAEEGRSLLMECCINNPAMFERLAELNPDFERRDRNGKTALILAAEWGRLELVDALLARGAKANAADGAGRTALMYAARGKGTQTDADYLAIVRLLLEAGADPAQCGWDDKNALDYALEGDKLCGVRYVQEGVAEYLSGSGRRRMGF